MRIPLMSPSLAAARKPYFFAVGGSFVMLQILFLANLCYLYGALWKSDHRMHNLHILMVDYDQGAIGESVRLAGTILKADNFPTISERSSANFITGNNVESAVCRGDYWGAIYINEGATANLSNALAGQSPDTFDPTQAITFVWNQIRYPTTAINVYSNLLILSETAKAIYLRTNGSTALQTLNTTSPSTAQVLFNPFSATSINLSPTPQSARFLLNTASIVMYTLMQFFFILAFNGITTTFNFYTTIPIRTLIVFRLLASLLYAFIGALLSCTYIWAFRETWDLNGVQFVQTWAILCLVMHVNFLVLDAVIATIPISFVPFFTFTWIIVNITSTVMPFDVSAGFYRVGYALPAHELWTVMIQIWSKGCYNRLSRALPILFAWEVIMLAVDVWRQVVKGRAATVEQEEVERQEEGQTVSNRQSLSGTEIEGKGKTV
ncbi:hypothetical protein IFR04_009115 [Cadophora malorum]|uniref:DUF3533 domain-containing protein n=1 Tax=Cadophora malorum TaxID=108018 RepID=A0A8H7W4X1_9HELO|nr:hypothetical protein IFR04_009115 [Cadophora malorum]